MYEEVDGNKVQRKEGVLAIDIIALGRFYCWKQDS